jgi:hypothetical protein
LLELVATLDGELEATAMLDARKRLLLDASVVLDRMETDSVIAARLRVLSIDQETL